MRGRKGREGAPEETARGLAVGEADRVEVKGASAAGAERVLHGSLSRLTVVVRGPIEQAGPRRSLASAGPSAARRPPPQLGLLKTHALLNQPALETALLLARVKENP